VFENISKGFIIKIPLLSYQNNIDIALVFSRKILTKKFYKSNQITFKNHTNFYAYKNQ
jgi:hypothetical protein